MEGQTNLSAVTIYPGDFVTIDALSKNVGNASSNTSVPYKWWWGYSSGDKHQQITDGNGNDVDGTIAGVNGLQPNEEEWVSEVVVGGIDPDNWVVNLLPGTYWLTFEIDSPNQNDEGANEGNNTRSELLTVISPNDGKFMSFSPWQFVKGERLPIIFAYKNYPDAYLPNLNYATVKIGPTGNQLVVDLYPETGSTSLNSFGVAGHSIEFTNDLGGDYYEICNDADWWYTVGYVRPEEYLDTQYWTNNNPAQGTGTLPVEVTYAWKMWG